MSRAEKIAFYRRQFEKLSTEELVAKRTINGDGEVTSAAIDQILESRKDKTEKGRHSEAIRTSWAQHGESLDESRKANRLAWIAIGVATVALLVSAYSVFRSDRPEQPVAAQSAP